MTFLYILGLLTLVGPLYGEAPAAPTAKPQDSLFGKLKWTVGDWKQKAFGKGSKSNSVALWESACAVLSCVPLLAVDSERGVIETDWFVLDETPNVRYKIRCFMHKRIVVSVDKEKRHHHHGEHVWEKCAGGSPVALQEALAALIRTHADQTVPFAPNLFWNLFQKG